MKVKPLRDRLIVKRIEEETTSAGGIVIPDAAKEKSSEGRVVAVGKGVELEDGTIRELEVEVGDRVFFGKYAGTEIAIHGEKHLIMREDDILCVFERSSRENT